MFNYVQSIPAIEKEVGVNLSKVYACDGIMIMHNFNIARIKNIEDLDISEFEIIKLEYVINLPDEYFKHKNIIIEVR